MVSTAALAVRWWRVLEEHRRAPGTSWCPRCRRWRCRPWAAAFAWLVAHDQWHLGPPSQA
ncbi:hypothetical protein C1I93_20365 [Micromonospora endophytica]|uniref:Uncharacterized protein n=1 Tax=Micromonospora endophytica TaxID=515350 RepID=A0A2W2CUB3_9ACTN|nr:hypothetical protein C1I93_20365 [Micromonospora endophytica]RIW41655.1 hypothetical protein D3H59_25495 [Micromonospora endophytica]